MLQYGNVLIKPVLFFLVLTFGGYHNSPNIPFSQVQTTVEEFDIHIA
jgi:hypothetical protein